MKLCRIRSGASDALFVWLFALVFAMIEIEVEGPDGWAKNLPTPKNVLAHLSLYHVYMVLLAVVVVSGFVYFRYTRPCTTTTTFPLTCRPARPAPHPLLMILFHIVLYFLVQDFLWFVLNPKFTVLGYTQANIPWHKPWVGGVPLFNFVGLFVVVCVAFATHLDERVLSAFATYIGLVLAVCLASPLYHMFYNYLH